MSQQLKLPDDSLVLKNAGLSCERTQLSYACTLMAWVRTAASMISFGFTLYKFFEEFSETERPAQRILTRRFVWRIM